MLKLIWDAVIGTKDGTGWIDLDDRMRAKLKLCGVFSVFVLLSVIFISCYFYLQLPPVKELVDKLLGEVKQSIHDKREIPKYILTIGTGYFTALGIVSLLFFWALIDFGQMHYKLDRLSYRILPAVQREIINLTCEALACPNTQECRLKMMTLNRKGLRKFMNDLFYYFANRDEVGDHNQKDKRRQVFAVWGKYYVFNYTMVILALIALWASFLAFIRENHVFDYCALTVFVVVVFWSIRRRRTFKDSILELAGDQVRAFRRFAARDFTDRAKDLVALCNDPGCPLTGR